MTLEDLLEALRPLPATAYVVVKRDATDEGAFIDTVTYSDGEVVLLIDPNTPTKDRRQQRLWSR